MRSFEKGNIWVKLGVAKLVGLKITLHIIAGSRAKARRAQKGKARQKFWFFDEMITILFDFLLKFTEEKILIFGQVHINFRTKSN